VCLMDVLFCFHTILVLFFLFIPPLWSCPLNHARAAKVNVTIVMFRSRMWRQRGGQVTCPESAREKGKTKILC
jgi:hypothetical protein